jgi:hypothetical protein
MEDADGRGFNADFRGCNADLRGLGTRMGTRIYADLARIFADGGYVIFMALMPKL